MPIQILLLAWCQKAWMRMRMKLRMRGGKAGIRPLNCVSCLSQFRQSDLACPATQHDKESSINSYGDEHQRQSQCFLNSSLGHMYHNFFFHGAFSFSASTDRYWNCQCINSLVVINIKLTYPSVCYSCTYEYLFITTSQSCKMAMEVDVVHRNIQKHVSSDTGAGRSMGKWSVMPDL